MQQIKLYTAGMFKGEVSKQFDRDKKKMAKEGWRVQAVSDESMGKQQSHVGNLKVTYEK
jgi:hypothetical protein